MKKAITVVSSGPSKPLSCDWRARKRRGEYSSVAGVGTTSSSASGSSSGSTAFGSLNLSLMGHPPMTHERVEGVWGNREVPPHRRQEGGNVGETWFPPRERAEGERRSPVDG